MAKYELLPWPIGQTASCGVTGATGSTDKLELEGREYLIEDLDYSSGSVFKPRAFYGNTGANRFKRVRVVRNVSGVAILPRQLCIFKGGVYGGQVDGLCNLTAQECYPADEFLPTAGVANNDLFYVTVDGCAELLTDLAGAGNNVFNAATAGANSGAGNWVTALTAVTSQATTAGRCVAATYGGATTALAAQIQNRIGICLSAMTTTQTNAAVLVYVRHW
jgi:hypothetical protein